MSGQFFNRHFLFLSQDEHKSVSAPQLICDSRVLPRLFYSFLGFRFRAELLVCTGSSSASSSSSFNYWDE